MKLTEVQRDHFRTFLEDALGNHLSDEISYYLENLADYQFSSKVIDNGALRDCLFEEANKCNLVFTNE